MMPQQSTMIDTFETCLWNNYWGDHSEKKITMTARYSGTKDEKRVSGEFLFSLHPKQC